MGRGRSSSGGSSRGSSSSGSRGASRSSWGGNRGGLRSVGRWGGTHHTTIFVGGSSGGGSNMNGVSSRVVPAIFLLLMGICILFGGVGLFSNSISYGTTYGTCLYNEYSGGWYYTTYSYTVDGKDYVNRSDEGWEFPEEEGRTVKIYYKKGNPYSITEKNPSNVGVAIFVLVLGAGFSAGGVALIVSAVKLSKKKKMEFETLEAPYTSLPSQPVEENKFAECPYCGGKYDNNLHECPRCGATRK